VIYWVGVRALVEALIDSKFKELYSIRLWKSGIEDEGVRELCKWLTFSNSTVMLDLLQNEITSVGCEVLAKVIGPQTVLSSGMMSPTANLQVLKLDHNPIGTEGFSHLAKAISANKLLKVLSVTYCNIDEGAGEDLFKMALYQYSALEDLNLSGNKLKNAGVIRLLQGYACGKQLKKLTICDNEWTDESEELMDALHNCMVKNKVLANYDLKHNNLTDEGVLKIVATLGEAKHVSMIEISEWISESTLTLFKDAVAANKPKKGGKRKGKKKK
jgi:Ran GTPase-activating protein (RanGAP) involved in mRNA processing and transport